MSSPDPSDSIYNGTPSANPQYSRGNCNGAQSPTAHTASASPSSTPHEIHQSTTNDNHVPPPTTDGHSHEVYGKPFVAPGEYLLSSPHAVRNVGISNVTAAASGSPRANSMDATTYDMPQYDSEHTVEREPTSVPGHDQPTTSNNPGSSFTHYVSPAPHAPPTPRTPREPHCTQQAKDLPGPYYRARYPPVCSNCSSERFYFASLWHG